MRLPEFLTELSPVRETLAALEQGENAMAEAVAEKNGQVLQFRIAGQMYSSAMPTSTTCTSSPNQLARADIPVFPRVIFTA